MKERIRFIKPKFKTSVELNTAWIAFSNILGKKYNYIKVQCEKIETANLTL